MSASRVTAADAMAKAESALAEIGAHERECSLRYLGIENAIKAQVDANKEIRGWIISTFVAVLLAALSGVAWLLNNPVQLVHPPAVQTQQTQVTVKTAP